MIKLVVAAACMFGTGCEHTAEMHECPPANWLPSTNKVSTGDKVDKYLIAVQGCRRKYGTCPKWLKKTGPQSYWVLCMSPDGASGIKLAN